MIANPNPHLMRIFDFTAADLEVNRRGRLSKRNVDRLQKIYNKQRSSFWFAAIGLPVVMCIALLIFQPPYGVGMFLCFPLPTACAMLFFIFLRDRKLASDIAMQKVEQLEGEVKCWSDSHDYGYIRINGHQLEIDFDTNLKLRGYMKEQTKALSLRVFFSPATKVILSSEILK